MNFFSISYTHKNTSIDIREKLAFNSDIRTSECLKLILANNKINECVILSTCNRIEIMCYVNDFIGINDYIIKCLCLICKIDESLIKNLPDIYEDSGFLHHLFSVASSLDSLVIGETQIVGQLKNALLLAKNYQNDINNLENVINYAFKCAALVRNQTQISKNPVSVSSVAVNKAKECIDIKNEKILLIGSGQMINLAAKHLLNHSNNLFICSRTLQNAKNLAQELKVNYLDYKDLKNFLNDFKIIFSATSSNEAIINDEMIIQKDYKRFYFDIAIPRDINISTYHNIEVFSVDDLNEIVKKNMSFKDEQAKIAYSIIANMVYEFYNTQSKTKITPIIKSMRLKANVCIENELKKAIKKGYIKNSNEEEVYKFAKQVMNAYLHELTIKIKNYDEHLYDIESINYLFLERQNDEIH